MQPDAASTMTIDGEGMVNLTKGNSTVKYSQAAFRKAAAQERAGATAALAIAETEVTNLNTRISEIDANVANLPN